jgi:TRAP-type C4-dicarboxylate transport system permease small subunit
VGGAESQGKWLCSPFDSQKEDPSNQMKLLENLVRIFDSTLNILVILTCLILTFVTVSVCLEVVLRYFFNRPQVWVIELSEYALLYITFLGAAWVLKLEGHVTVDLVTNRLSPKGRAFFSFISFVICSIVSGVLFLYGTRVTWSYFSKGLYNPTILEIPTAAILIVIPVGGITLLVQSVRGACQSLLIHKRGKA